MKGISTTKFCKGTELPKHSGNYSPIRMHFCQRTYPICKREDGMVIIGKGTLAQTIIPQSLIDLMYNDKFFKTYRREGKYKRNGLEYNCWMDINRCLFNSLSEFDFRLSIDTRGDFEYEFPEY